LEFHVKVKYGPVRTYGLVLTLSLAVLDHRVLEAVVFVSSSRRARRVLGLLLRLGRMSTTDLMYAAFGRVSRDDHRMLRVLESLGLIRRYRGVDKGHWVVWNEITELGRRVLEIVESMEG